MLLIRVVHEDITSFVVEREFIDILLAVEWGSEMLKSYPGSKYRLHFEFRMLTPSGKLQFREGTKINYRELAQTA